MPGPLSPVAFSLSETGQLLGASRQTVRRMVDKGQLHAVEVGTHLRIPRWSLEEFLGQPLSDDQVMPRRTPRGRVEVLEQGVIS